MTWNRKISSAEIFVRSRFSEQPRIWVRSHSPVCNVFRQKLKFFWMRIRPWSNSFISDYFPTICRKRRITCTECLSLACSAGSPWIMRAAVYLTKPAKMRKRLESAACHLRASPRPARTTPAGDREILRGRQEGDLLAWAAENSCLTRSSFYLDLIEDAGQEHRAWLDTARQRYFKVTFPSR